MAHSLWMPSFVETKSWGVQYLPQHQCAFKVVSSTNQETGEELSSDWIASRRTGWSWTPIDKPTSTQAGAESSAFGLSKKSGEIQTSLRYLPLPAPDKTRQDKETQKSNTYLVLYCFKILYILEFPQGKKEKQTKKLQKFHFKKYFARKKGKTKQKCLPNVIFISKFFVS